MFCCCLAAVQAFAEVLADNESWTAPMDETYQLLGVDPTTITSLDTYLQVRCYCYVLLCVLLCCICYRKSIQATESDIIGHISISNPNYVHTCTSCAFVPASGLSIGSGVSLVG